MKFKLFSKAIAENKVKTPNNHFAFAMLSLHFYYFYFTRLKVKTKQETFSQNNRSELRTDFELGTEIFVRIIECSNYRSSNLAETKLKGL